METPNDRLRKAREHAGFKSAAAFAATHNLTESTYRSAENGSRGLRLSAARQYAPLLGVTWQWLIEGGDMPVLPLPHRHKGTESREGEENSSQTLVTASEINIQQMPRDVPILGAGACGENGLFEFNGQSLDYARRPPRLKNVRDAYALYISGNSMSPWREEGQLVYVHPHQPVKVGDYVVVQLHGKEGDIQHPAYIKKLVRRTAEHLKLSQYKPEDEIVIPIRKVKVIHRIIDWDELLGL